MRLSYVLWLVKKWFWLIILAALIGGAVALAVNSLQTKVYAASTTLYVNALNRNDYQGALGAQQAAKAFASFPQSDRVLQATLDAVGDRNLSLPQLSSMVSVQNNLNTQFVVITVSNGDPRLAAQLASEIAKQSITQFVTSQTNNLQSQQFIQRQMASLQTEINNLQEQLTQAQLGIPTPEKTALVNRLTTKLSNDQQFYSQLLTAENSISGYQVTVVQQPQIPQNPVGLGKKYAIAIGVLVGLLVIVCVILFIEQTRRILVIHPGDQITVLDQDTGLPVVLTLKDLPGKDTGLPTVNTVKDPPGTEKLEQAETLKLPTKDSSLSIVNKIKDLSRTEKLEQAETLKLRGIVLSRQVSTPIIPETPRDDISLNGFHPQGLERGVNGISEP